MFSFFLSFHLFTVCVCVCVCVCVRVRVRVRVCFISEQVQYVRESPLRSLQREFKPGEVDTLVLKKTTKTTKRTNQTKHS